REGTFPRRDQGGIEMTLRFGCVYRHRLSGVVFRVDEIWIRENPIEGVQSVAVRCVVEDEDQYTCVVGDTVIARWWPHLEEVGVASQAVVAAAFAANQRDAAAEFFDPSVTLQGADGELPD